MLASDGDVDDAIDCFPGAVSVLREFPEGAEPAQRVEVCQRPLEPPSLPPFHREAYAGEGATERRTDAHGPE